MTTNEISAEQMCRDLLEIAIRERLVARHNKAWDDPDPQSRSAGELVAMANQLRAYRHGTLAKMPDAERLDALEARVERLEQDAKKGVKS